MMMKLKLAWTVAEVLCFGIFNYEGGILIIVPYQFNILHGTDIVE